MTLEIPPVRKDDWTRLRVIIDKLKHLRMGVDSSPRHLGLTLTGLTASTLIGANASKALESVTIGTGLDYTRPTLSLSHLGIESLTDPGSDRILFWDDSETACKWLDVGNSVAITTTTFDTIQDIRTSASPTFANLSLGTGELTCGSINRATGTLTLEISGTTEVSITSTAVTLGGNLIIPDSGTIGSASDTDVMTIDASGNCTFSVFPITPSVAPDADYEVANKKYVDDNAGGGGGFSSRISVWLNGNQSIPSGAWTQIQLNTEVYDNDNEFASYKFTATAAGYYHATAKVQFNSVAAGKDIYITIRKNGSNSATILKRTAGTYEPLQVSGDFYLNGGTDYLDVACFNGDAVARNISGAIADTNFFVHRFA